MSRSEVLGDVPFPFENGHLAFQKLLPSAARILNGANSPYEGMIMRHEELCPPCRPVWRDALSIAQEGISDFPRNPERRTHDPIQKL